MMKYLRYFERKDVEQSQKLLDVAKDIINKFYEKWNEFVENYEDGEFDFVFYSFESMTYGDFFIYIVGDTDKRGSFSKNPSGGAKYVIKVAHPELYATLKACEKLVVEDRPKAREVINELKEDKSIYDHFILVLSHELSHYEDELKYSIFDDKKLNKLRDIKTRIFNLLNSKPKIGVKIGETPPDPDPLSAQEEQKIIDLQKQAKTLYFNLNTEYNAYFLMFCSTELEALYKHHKESNEKWIDMTFQEYYKYFQNTVSSKAEFDEKTTKRLQKRLYQFYEDIKKLDDELSK